MAKYRGYRPLFFGVPNRQSGEHPPALGVHHRHQTIAAADKQPVMVYVYRHALRELLKSQGMAENQQVVFFFDGGDSLGQMQEHIHPFSEHWIDWLHITMQISVLQQQIKGLQDEQLDLGEEAARELDRIKHFLWHGNTFQALPRLEGLSWIWSFQRSLRS